LPASKTGSGRITILIRLEFDGLLVLQFDEDEDEYIQFTTASEERESILRRELFVPTLIQLMVH
jgi:hypothetical protein